MALGDAMDGKGTRVSASTYPKTLSRTYISFGVVESFTSQEMHRKRFWHVKEYHSGDFEARKSHFRIAVNMNKQLQSNHFHPT